MTLFCLSFLLLLGGEMPPGQDVNEPIVGRFFTSGDGQPKPGCLLLGGAEGGVPWQHDTQKIDDLVKAGYQVLALAYFRHEGLPETLERIPLEYFAEALVWLRQHPKVSDHPLTLVAHSKGAEAALLLAGRHAEIGKLVALSPPSHHFQGIPRGFQQAPHPSWTGNGQDLPFVPFLMDQTAMEALKQQKFTAVYTRSLAFARHPERARISLEKTRAKVLLVCGESDRIWPSCNMTAAHFSGRNLQHVDTLNCAAGHEVQSDSACWQRVLAFLRNDEVPPPTK